MKTRIVTVLFVIFSTTLVVVGGYSLFLGGKVVYKKVIEPVMEKEKMEKAIQKSLPDRVAALEQELAKLKSEKPVLIETP